MDWFYNSSGISNFSFNVLFIFESEREHEQGGAERGERDRIRSRVQALSYQHSARCGLELTNGEIMT